MVSGSNKLKTQNSKLILVLGGTTEGKQVATLLENEQHPYLYSTKTGAKRVVRNCGRQIEGTLDEMKMINLCRTENIHLIIDAAHPFALVLHQLVFSVSSTLGIPLIRFERASVARIKAENIYYVANYEAAMEHLHQLGSPKLLALSGVQSIPKLADYWQLHETWFRILDRPESIALAEKHQFPNERLIRAYPSDHLAGEMTLYQQLQVAAVLTKESGHSGKLSMKIEAATRLGIALLIICKPNLPAYDLVVHDEAELISMLNVEC